MIRTGIACEQISPVYPTLEKGFEEVVSAVCGFDPLSSPDTIELVRHSRRNPKLLVRYYCTDEGKIVQVQ